MSMLPLPPDPTDFAMPNSTVPAVLPRLMVVFGGVFVLAGAWLLGSGTEPTVGAVLVVAGVMDALAALFLARRG